MEKIITKRANGTIRIQTVVRSESKTSQSEKDNCDINRMMEKYNHQMPPAVDDPSHYGNFSQNKTYQDSLNAVVDSRTKFESLPWKIRARFENNPQNLINFLQDKNNLDEAIEIGLIKKKAETSKNNDDDSTTTKKKNIPPKNKNSEESSEN